MAGVDAHLDVNGSYAAGNGGHATCHQAHQFAACHARHVGFNHQRRLRLAHKYVGRGREGFAAARAHDFPHHPRDRAHHALQQAPVIKQR